MKKRILSVISSAVLVIMIIAVCVLALPRLFGVKMFSVLTGSMTPEYPIGTLIYVVPTDFEDLEVGDVVTYVFNEQLDVVTHRIVSIDEESRTVTTHGDANDVGVNDKPVTYENVLGVVRFKIPGLGGVATFLSTKYGKIIAIAAIAVIAALSILTGGPDKKKKDDSPVLSDGE